MSERDALHHEFDVYTVRRTYDNYSREVRLLRVNNVPKVARGKRWRWDVTIYRKVEGIHPGVKDRREHLGAHSGYTYTKAGALREIGIHLNFAQWYQLDDARS